MRRRLFAPAFLTLIACAPIFAIAQPAAKPASPARSAPEPAEAPAFDWSLLSPDHQRRVERAAKYYVRLPDGRCVNAFRVIRILELRDSDRHPSRSAALESLDGVALAGAEPPSPDSRKVRWVNPVPSVQVLEHVHAVLPPLDPKNPDVKVARRGTSRVVELPGGLELSLGDNDTFAVPQRLEDSLLLVPEEQAVVGRLPRFQAVKIFDNQPDPKELAKYLVENDLPLIEYPKEPTADIQQRTRKVVAPGAAGQVFVEPKVVKVGPAEWTYRWPKKEPGFKLRMLRPRTPAPAATPTPPK